MSVTVELTYDMGKALGVDRFDLEGARTVADALRMAKERFAGGPGADEFERLSRVTAVAVNGVLMSYRKGRRTPLESGDTVTFVKAAAGG
ncbi:MAG: MoaD/ThiS family protein [Myxococcota bacterium]